MVQNLERFTQLARNVLVMAREEAQRLGHHYIGTEHLLIGLLREQDGMAFRVLHDSGLDADTVRVVVRDLVGAGESSASAMQLGDQTRVVIEAAVLEAKRLGHRNVGTEHLLLGLIRESDSMGVAVLRHLNVRSDVVRQKTLMMIRERMTPVANAPQEKTRGQHSVLDEVGIDLTELARQGALDPVIGRTKEIERVVQILARRNKNNPALIGEPGVGKTAIVEGLAQRIVQGRVPADLEFKRVVRLDVGTLVAGTMYRGQFEERLKHVIDELKSSDTIVFIDELHMIVGAGAAGNQVDAANILKPALSRGEIQCIGATTLDEYRKHIESDAALERRFQPVYVEEPSVEDTVAILKGVRSRYEAHHGLKISDEAIEAAARLAARYVSGRFLPDKAIDLVDEAASRVRVFKHFEGERSESEDDLLSLETIYRQDSLLASFDQGEDIKFEFSEQVVRAEDIAEIVAMWTGVPVASMAESESERLLHMEDELHKRIVGQDRAIKILARAVRRARAGLRDPRRPIASLIFLGPTGVGKTELCKALAGFMFGSDDALLQLDMSEFMERHTLSRLVGAPPGYVGYDSAGQLTEAVRRRPYTVVCFDEIEKAHPEAFNMLLQIMEEGHLSDARGRKVDFRNTIIIMTSNIGSDVITRDVSLGFDTAPEELAERQRYSDMKGKLLTELKHLVRPEFLNRVDDVVVFHQLSRDEISQIIEIQLAELNQRLEPMNIQVSCSEAGREALLTEGYDPQYGARPMRRAVQRLIEDPLAEQVLDGVLRAGDHVLVDSKDGEIILQPNYPITESSLLLSGDRQ